MGLTLLSAVSLGCGQQLAPPLVSEWFFAHTNLLRRMKNPNRPLQAFIYGTPRRTNKIENVPTNIPTILRTRGVVAGTLWDEVGEKIK
jgi:hypothetical protein